MATSEGDISLTAANIVAEQDVGIHAAGDLSIRSGQDTLGNANASQSKAIGTVQISDTEKFSGWHRQQHEDDSAQVSQVASSLGGSVNLSAGGSYSQIASNVVAAQDINITATSIELLTADETGNSSQRDDDLKIGAFARVKSPLIDLINNVDAARQSDGRLQQMQGMAAAANAYQAASAVAAIAGKGGSGTLAAAEAGIGFKSASSSADSHSVVSQGSTLQAGGNLNLTSTGGDIHVVQGNLSAGNSLSLDSAGDILLEAGKSQLADRSQSSNAGVEVGMGASVGAQTGVYAYAEASVGSSRSNATSSTWHNTTLSGQQISLRAAGDTTLRGATATADRIDVTTGGTLTIESLQDVAQSESKNSQVGGRVQVSFGTAWDASGYAIGGQADGNYQAVGEQSGLFAGDGGYHVQAGHVNLVGGAIASTNAGNSELTAQTLTFSDLHNSMEHQASSGSISGGFGGAAGDYQGSNTSLGKPDGGSFGGGVPMIESGSDRSTTHATLTEGNIVIGGQQSSAAALGINTDAAAAHRALDAMPNAEQQLANQQAMAAAVGTVVGTSKQIAGDIQAHQANKAVDAYFAGLSPDDQTRFIGLDAAARDKELSANSPAYQNAKQWGIGGANSRALEAVTTLLVGATSGQVGSQVVANALAPYAAQLIGETFDPNKPSAVPSEAMQLLSHALLGALLAEVNGGNAASGAGAAAGGELAAKLITEALYPGKVADLDDQQKANILALSQAVGALAGGIGSDLAGAALGAEVAGNSIENNYLDSRQLLALAEDRKDCNGNEACENEAIDRWAKVSKQQGLEMLAACQIADAVCDLQFSQAWQYGKYDVSRLGLNLDQAASKELVMRFLETTSGEAYRGSTGSFFLQMAKGAVDSASQLITGGLGYALAFGDVALAPQYHRDPVTGEFKYDPLIDAMPIFGDTSGNPVEAGGYRLGSLAGIDLALFGVARKSGEVAVPGKVVAATGAENSANSVRLRTQLIAEEIADGHAFDKHVVVQGEFSGLGVRTRKQFAQHIEDVVTNPSSVRYYADGRVVYLQESTRTVVFKNPSAEGTAFRPADWNDYVSKLPRRTDPPGTGVK